MFETFDLKEFGKFLKDLRKSLSYTQKDIERISGVSSDTLRRIESGSVLPRYDTLVYLSLAYKKDLLEDLKSYRNSNVIFQYYTRLDSLILKYNLSALQDLEKDFEKFSNNQKEELFLNTFIKEQFLLLLKGISILNSKDPTASLEYFINAMKKSIPLFDLEMFESIKYTHFETRILMLIAIVLAKKKDLDISTKILKECLSMSNFDYEATSNEKLMICKLYFELAYNAHRIDRYKEVIQYSDKGIEYCNKHYISYPLAALFYRKGIAEFNLGLNSHISSLKKSISLLLITNNAPLAKIYAKTAYDMYDIKINIEEL